LFFVAENVRGLLSLDNGRVIQLIINDFKSAGYSVKYKLFNMADFGVPQDRRRVIILGKREELSNEVEPEFPKTTHSKYPNMFHKKWVTISEALQGIPEPNKTTRLKNHICS